MEQLYYTSCRSGFSVDGGSGGFKIRSLSTGLTLSAAKELSDRLGYMLPGHDFNVSTAPVRLALLPGKSGETLLIHSRYLGEDPDTGRQGNYFSHAILVSPDTSARDAIRTWESPEWKQENGDYDSSLPPCDSLPHETTFGRPVPINISEFAAHPENAPNLIWLVNAILSIPARFDQVIMIGDSNYVAWVIYCALHLLPDSVSKRTMFSTYEKNPLTASAAVIGTVFPDGLEAPASFFRDGKAALNIRTGKKTEVPSNTFADLILEGLSADTRFDVFSLIETLDRCEGINTKSLNLIAEFLLGKIDNPVQVSRLLETLPIEIWPSILSREEQWNLIAESVFELREINDGIRKLFSIAPAEARNAIHSQCFERIGTELRTGGVEEISRITELALPLSGYPITPDWLAQLDPEKLSASMGCRLYLYRWLDPFPDLRSEAESWLHSAPLAQIQQLYANKFDPKPKEMTPAILAEALFAPMTSNPIAVGKLIPKIGHETIPLLIEKIHQWQGVGGSQKIEIVRQLIESALSMGLSTEAVILPASESGAQSLQLKALLAVDHHLALAVWTKLSQNQSQLPPQISNELRELEMQESGVTPSIPVSGQTPVVDAEEIKTPSIDPLAGPRHALKCFTFEPLEVEKVEKFVDLVRETELAEIEIAKEVADAILANLSATAEIQPEKLSIFLFEVDRRIPVSSIGPVTRGWKFWIRRNQVPVLSPFWEDLLVSSQNKLHLKGAVTLSAAVAIHLNRKKIRKVYPPLLNLLTFIFSDHAGEANRVLGTFIDRAPNRGCKRVLKNHWKRAKRFKTKRPPTKSIPNPKQSAK